MPKSKRDKKVSLTKTAKHGKEWKKEMYTKVRDSAEAYNNIFVIRMDGLRIGAISEVRKHFRGSEIYMGKNKVMQIALGKDQASEVNENIHKLASRLVGQCGLLFTDQSEDEVVSYFDSFTETDYARGGAKVKQTVVLEEGPLTQFAHNIEPHLRSLGMPTALKKGVVTLLQRFEVCKKGKPLTPNQANILKLLAMPLAEFRVSVDSVWSKPNDFKILLKKEDSDSEDDGDEDEDDDEGVELDDEVEVLEDNNVDDDDDIEDEDMGEDEDDDN